VRFHGWARRVPVPPSEARSASSLTPGRSRRRGDREREARAGDRGTPLRSRRTPCVADARGAEPVTGRSPHRLSSRDHRGSRERVRIHQIVRRE
jgi:hypothetical protein